MLADYSVSVIVNYEVEETDGNKIQPNSITHIIINAQHTKTATRKDMKSQLKDIIFNQCNLPEFLLNKGKRPKLLFNKGGSFTIGGPERHAGMSNKKIQYDSYGGGFIVGSSQESIAGRDATHIQKAALLYSRYIAKSLVHHKLCHRVSVQLFYIKGLKDLLSLQINSFNTCSDFLTDNLLEDIVKQNFDLTL